MRPLTLSPDAHLDLMSIFFIEHEVMAGVERLRFLWILLSMRIGGRYRASPFFDATGSLIMRPIVRFAEKRQALGNTG